MGSVCILSRGWLREAILTAGPEPVRDMPVILVFPCFLARDTFISRFHDLVE